MILPGRLSEYSRPYVMRCILKLNHFTEYSFRKRIRAACSATLGRGYSRPTLYEISKAGFCLNFM